MFVSVRHGRGVGERLLERRWRQSTGHTKEEAEAEEFVGAFDERDRHKGTDGEKRHRRQVMVWSRCGEYLVSAR